MHKLSRRAALRLGLVVALPLVVPPSSFAMDLPLAIQGYDPVAYFTDGKPTPGRQNSSINGTNTPIDSRAPKIASYLKPTLSTTLRNSAITAPWR